MASPEAMPVDHSHSSLSSNRPGDPLDLLFHHLNDCETSLLDPTTLVESVKNHSSQNTQDSLSQKTAVAHCEVQDGPSTVETLPVRIESPSQCEQKQAQQLPQQPALKTAVQSSPPCPTARNDQSRGLNLTATHTLPYRDPCNAYSSRADSVSSPASVSISTSSAPSVPAPTSLFTEVNNNPSIPKAPTNATAITDRPFSLGNLPTGPRFVPVLSPAKPLNALNSNRAAANITPPSRLPAMERSQHSSSTTLTMPTPHTTTTSTTTTKADVEPNAHRVFPLFSPPKGPPLQLTLPPSASPFASLTSKQQFATTFSSSFTSISFTSSPRIQPQIPKTLPSTPPLNAPKSPRVLFPITSLPAPASTSSSPRIGYSTINIKPTIATPTPTPTITSTSKPTSSHSAAPSAFARTLLSVTAKANAGKKEKSQVPLPGIPETAYRHREIRSDNKERRGVRKATRKERKAQARLATEEESKKEAKKEKAVFAPAMWTWNGNVAVAGIKDETGEDKNGNDNVNKDAEKDVYVGKVKVKSEDSYGKDDVNEDAERRPDRGVPAWTIRPPLNNPDPPISKKLRKKMRREAKKSAKQAEDALKLAALIDPSEAVNPGFVAVSEAKTGEKRKAVLPLEYEVDCYGRECGGVLEEIRLQQEQMQSEESLFKPDKTYEKQQGGVLEEVRLQQEQMQSEAVLFATDEDCGQAKGKHRGGKRRKMQIKQAGIMGAPPRPTTRMPKPKTHAMSLGDLFSWGENYREKPSGALEETELQHQQMESERVLFRSGKDGVPGERRKREGMIVMMSRKKQKTEADLTGSMEQNCKAEMPMFEPQLHAELKHSAFSDAEGEQHAVQWLSALNVELNARHRCHEPAADSRTDRETVMDGSWNETAGGKGDTTRWCRADKQPIDREVEVKAERKDSMVLERFEEQGPVSAIPGGRDALQEGGSCGRMSRRNRLCGQRRYE